MNIDDVIIGAKYSWKPGDNFYWTADDIIDDNIHITYTDANRMNEKLRISFSALEQESDWHLISRPNKRNVPRDDI